MPITEAFSAYNYIVKNPVHVVDYRLDIGSYKKSNLYETEFLT
jgi:hypothetical protein